MVSSVTLKIKYWVTTSKRYKRLLNNGFQRLIVDIGLTQFLIFNSAKISNIKQIILDTFERFGNLNPFKNWQNKPTSYK
jgi:hypothetical protein